MKLGDRVRISPDYRIEELRGLSGRVISDGFEGIGVDLAPYANSHRFTHSCGGRLKRYTGRFFMPKDLVPDKLSTIKDFYNEIQGG